MKIQEFDIEKGVYCFEMDALATTRHAHPVVEIISSIEGTFSLNTEHQTREGLVFAIIDANQKHDISASQCKVQIMMLESHNSLLGDFLKNLDIKLIQGCYTKTAYPERKDIYEKIKRFAAQQDLKKPLDSRVETCLSIIQRGDLAYTELIPLLTSQVHLSESRLAHLFKAHIGVSLKKYLVWNKLKTAIRQHLLENKNLTVTSLDNGFFDQAHLSNAFKNILGVSPAKAYKSRILQV